jgi:hypothetical protein
LAGKQVNSTMVGGSQGLRCADLRGADLTALNLTQADLSGALASNANFSGVHLGQADLSGAQLDGAKLTGADLTQATLTGADFSNADLSHANLTQVEAAGVAFDGADLSDVDATQATMNDASFTGADLDGADFTQAELSGADFDNARGLTPWSAYVLIASLAVFVLLAALSVRRALKRRGNRADAPAPTPTTPVFASSAAGYNPSVPRSLQKPINAPFRPINPPASSIRGFAASLAIGLLGSLVAAFGVHLFLGGMIGTFSFAFDTLATATCSGPQCAVGVNSGTFGLVGGVFVVIAGFFIRARA